MPQNIILQRSSTEYIELEVETGVEVDDYVFINSAGKAEKALASDKNKMPCVGKVFKIKNGVCKIKQTFMEDSYSGVVPRSTFYISHTDAGEITDVIPPNLDNHVTQIVGFGASNDKVMVDIDMSNIVFLNGN